MRYLAITFCFAFLLSCNSSDKKTSETQAKDSTLVSASSTTASAPKTQMPDSAEMMKNWKAYMTPGKEHQMMKSWDGTWIGEATMMMPGTPVTKNMVTVVNKMTMGGRYQLTSQKGSFNGMPFEGMGTLGFDNSKKEFVLSWIDNMGSGIIKMEGPWNETTKSMDLRGAQVDPATGKEMDIRETFRVIDNDRQVMEMYGPGPDGKEIKTMQIIYTRKK